MVKSEERMLCRTPTPNRKPTRIATWKFDLVREAILDALPTEEPGVEFMKQLPALVSERLSDEDRQRLGSVGWYTTTVKLELEVRGEIRRVKGVTPQRLVRVAR